MSPLARNADTILAEILGPFRLPRHPLVLARFGLRAILPSATLARLALRRAARPRAARRPRGPLDASPDDARRARRWRSCSRSWHIGSAGRSRAEAPRRSRTLSLRISGRSAGEIETGRRVESLAELPRTRAVFADVTPRQLLRLAGDRLQAGYRRRLAALPLRAGRLQARPRPRRADSVACRRRAPGPRPSTWAGRSRRSWRPRRPCPGVRSRSARTCSSPSRASSIRPGRRPASTPPGRIATCRTDRQRT